MKNYLHIFVLATLASAVISCGGKKETTTEKVTTANVKEVVKREFDYPIPTSYEVTTLLQDADAAFVLDITNPVENVDKYETQRAKALNLGIYGADLSYASTYNMNEETLALIKVTKTLVDGLDVPGVFNESMVNRIESNIDNQDSLILIITESFYNTYEQLNKTGQEKLSFLVVSASWIEGLYITTQLAVSSNYDPRLMSIIAKQKTGANVLAEAAAKYVEDEDIKAIAPLLNYMKLTYDGVEPEVGITKGQLDDIMKNVESTRNEITG
ncbi:hypothetical protein N6H18_00610 [Reichenbachiella agarivorans]|uniref:Uncharacterized protein n=1 Tax=Reichenbachiella agarivorans TaxID=2979464 RepID=A0ABY6CPM9_9BACT|nr:hypothetical protein [Reichenbachiella agarivorans]UXP32476.1 hypothetical protein N6H18_00610 [Reichenbachiella agarivorans]